MTHCLGRVGGKERERERRESERGERAREGKRSERARERERERERKSSLLEGPVAELVGGSFSLALGPAFFCLFFQLALTTVRWFSDLEIEEEFLFLCRWKPRFDGH